MCNECAHHNNPTTSLDLDFLSYAFQCYQVFLGHDGLHDVEGNVLPRLVYISREKRPGFEHHKKAGAMNALVNINCTLSFIWNLAHHIL